MSKGERRWLRTSVLIGILAATVITIGLVMFAGMFGATPYSDHSLSGSANATMWSAASTVFGVFSLEVVVVLVAVIVVVVIFALIVTCGMALGRAGY